MLKRSRRDEKNTQKNCIKIDPNEPDYYDGVVSHPQSDILEWEVKWALRSTAVNKASGCNEIPELFKSLMDDAIKALYSLCQQIWKIQQWPQDCKRSVVITIPKFQFTTKNVLTIGQLYSSPMLIRSCLKSCMLGFSIMQIKNFQMSKLVLEKEEELESKLPTSAGL